LPGARRDNPMTRVLSGAALIAIAVYAVWFAPRLVFFAIAEVLLVLAFIEYGRLAAAAGVPVPRVASGALTVFTSIGVSATLWVGDRVVGTAVALDGILMSGFVGLALIAVGRWRGGGDALGRVSAALFPALYLGLPIGAMISIQALRGRETLSLLMLTIVVSDSAQYYVGRAFGKTLLAPAISPKKTVEGAAGGLLCGVALFVVVGTWWLPAVHAALRAIVGVAIVALGIAGDLFESMLKRSAGVKDSSSLIPGHGGVLDRVDALLFAAPMYYLVLKYTQ
jgi:phosphatidate cytidylyltransferase